MKRTITEKVQERVNKLLPAARRYAPDLAVRVDIGPGTEFPEERDYAYCEDCADYIRIVVAPDFGDLTYSQIQGVLRHELAHAVELELGDELGQIWHSLPRGAERRADAIARRIWDDPIRYDIQDIQTIGHGKSLRPTYLDEDYDD